MSRNRSVPFLLLIGGHEDRTSQSEIHREFVRLAGGPRARIVVCTAATSLPEAYGDEFDGLFTGLGAAEVTRLDVPDRQAASHPGAVAAIARATAVFFTGGDQQRLVDRILGTPVGNRLTQRAARGLLVGGTSAGAAMAGELMLIGTAVPTVEPGLGLWPGMIVDQHFAQRSRLGRLTTALAAHPGHGGVGVDEDTALLVTGTTISVLGSGQVTVIAPANSAERSRVVALGAGETASSPATIDGGDQLT